MNQIHLCPEWERRAPARQPSLRRQLPEAIAARFSGSKLDDLLYRLQVNEVLGRTMAERARELVLYMDRHAVFVRT